MRVVHRLAEALVQPTPAAMMIVGWDDLRRLIATESTPQRDYVTFFGFSFNRVFHSSLVSARSGPAPAIGNEIAKSYRAATLFCFSRKTKTED